MDDNLRAQVFRQEWKKKFAEIVSVETKDQIGKLYISKALNLGDDIANAFILGDSTAYHEVGIVQSGIPDNQEAVSNFWNSVNPLLPEQYPLNVVQWLIEPGGIDGIFTFILLLNSQHNEIADNHFSHVLHDLHVNAHAYK